LAIRHSGEGKVMANPIEIAKTRPAETAMPIATVFAALIAKLLGVEDTDTILYLALALSFVPAAVTWCVELWREKERKKEEPLLKLDATLTKRKPDEP
jgi:hypothetical protein